MAFSICLAMSDICRLSTLRPLPSMFLIHLLACPCRGKRGGGIRSGVLPARRDELMSQWLVLSLCPLLPQPSLPPTHLRVDHEWPACAARDHDPVLCGEAVGGQPLDVPVAHILGVRQEQSKVKVLRRGDVQRLDLQGTKFRGQRSGDRTTGHRGGMSGVMQSLDHEAHNLSKLRAVPSRGRGRRGPRRPPPASSPPTHTEEGPPPSPPASHLRQPGVLDELISVLGREGSRVGHEGRGHHGVPRQLVQARLEVGDGELPADALA